MFNDFEFSSDGCHDTSFADCVRGTDEAHALGFFDNNLELFIRELLVLRIIVPRGDAAGSENLDDFSTSADIETNGLPALIWTIGMNYRYYSSICAWSVDAVTLVSAAIRDPIELRSAYANVRILLL